MPLTTPLKTARGLGSAREGVQHWWLQRLSALPLIPLGFWFVISMIGLARNSQPYQIRDWVAHPLHAWPLLFFLLLGFYHGYLGIKVIIEDYVHNKAVKLLAMLFTMLIATLFSVLSFVAIFNIATQG